MFPRWIDSLLMISVMVLPLTLGASELPEKWLNAKLSGIAENAIQLSDGRWEGAPHVEGGASRPSAGLVREFIKYGDLDGDGEDDSAVLVWHSSGGSGTFNSVAVLSGSEGREEHVITAPLGDRVQVIDGAISDGVLVLQVLQAAPEDAACCPRQLSLRSWVLTGNELEELNVQITGELSLSILQDTQWVLENDRHESHLPAEIDITVAFSGNRIAGSSGCNRFSATLEESAPGEIALGPIMGTRMACPEDIMTLESEFLDLLERVERYSFVGGQLLLSGQKETFTFSMRFNRTETN